ncbi:Hsp20/alpha crystallin family protein [Halanaeroarchaeum sulfurireducens]|uniref:Heat-shock protein Hsp20 n=1 Tax=Halanaeroarchaeum sulfurireducens TaxID=1604004 RepID=A0A0F7P8L8_9EURY|nr:Hsp20/alpha crystallin family protein [Halanaeroarchaeum sulfurireducens]AKH97102.1 heat-shock protein Hsp20 [Halanaeroarchaeum sulfurireducens]ALG81503.1 heat-shock protein Hsp20 [Halanaeroarchaeum sulfurireducens]
MPSTDQFRNVPPSTAVLAMTRHVPLVGPARRIGDAVVDTVGRVASHFHEETPLRSDVLESQDAILVVFDAPGATVSDLQVYFDDGGIEVSIDRFRPFYEEYEIRYPGRGMTLDGRADLPTDVLLNLERARATLRPDGTLHVRVPKAKDGELDDSDA